MTSLSRLRAWPRVAALFIICSVLHAGTCQHGAHRLNVKAKKDKSCPEFATQDATSNTHVLEAPHDGQEDSWSPLEGMGRLLGGMETKNRITEQSTHGNGAEHEAPQNPMKYDVPSEENEEDVKHEKLPYCGDALRQQLTAHYKDAYGTVALFSGRSQSMSTVDFQLGRLLSSSPWDSQVDDEEMLKRRVKHQLPECAESIASPQMSMSLEALFAPPQPGSKLAHSPKTICITGRAGIGKTTLCRKLAHAWASGTWHSDKFEAVYLLPVRNLQQSCYNGADFRSQAQLATAIVRECFNGHQLDKAAFERLVTHVHQQLNQRPGSVLLILDGLDAPQGVSQALVQQAKAYAKTTYTIWTARPGGSDHERNQRQTSQWALQVAHLGLSDEQVGLYIQRYFSDKAAAKAVALNCWLAAQPTLYRFAHVPIYLECLCQLWKAQEGRLKALQGAGITALFSAIVAHVGTGKAPQDHSPGKKAIKRREVQQLVLGKLALAGLQQRQALISEAIYQEQLSLASQKLGVKAERLAKLLAQSPCLCRESPGIGRRRARYFAHLGFQEYFAGEELARQLLSEEGEQKEATSFLHEHRYNPAYHRLIVFMAGALFRKAGKPGLDKVLQILRTATTREVVGLQDLLLQLRVANEAISLSQDRALLRASIEQRYGLRKHLCAWMKRSLKKLHKGSDAIYRVPHECLLASLPTLRHLLSGNDDVVSVYLQEAHTALPAVRAAALEGLGAVASVAPEHAETALKQLLPALQDDNEEVRFAVIRSIREVVKAAPKYIPLVLKPLGNACQDSSTRIHTYAAITIAETGQQAPKHTQLALETLLKTCNHYDWFSHSAKSELMALGEASPHYTPRNTVPEHKNSQWLVRSTTGVLAGVARASVKSPRASMETLSIALNEEEGHWAVRSSAANALGEIGKLSPRQASEAFEELSPRAQDANRYVRFSVMNALRKLVKKAPRHAEKTLKAMLAACNDRDKYVRLIAINTLGELAPLVPKQHASILKALLTACQDSYGDIRIAAITALGKLVEYVPEYVPVAFEAMLKRYTIDRIPGMRKTFTKSLERLVSTKALAAVLPKIQGMCKAQDARLRALGIQILGHVVSVDHKRATELLPVLLHAADNRDWSGELTKVAVEALEKLIRVAPQHAAAILPVLMKARVDDRFSSPKYAALRALKTLAKVAPAHATTVFKALIENLQSVKSISHKCSVIGALAEVIEVIPQHAPVLLQHITSTIKDDLAKALDTEMHKIKKGRERLKVDNRRILAEYSTSGLNRYKDLLQEVLEALVRLCQAAPQHAAQAVELGLYFAARGYNFDIYKLTAQTLVRLLQIAPQHTEEVFKCIKANLTHKNYNVTIAATSNLILLARAMPTQSAVHVHIASVLKDILLLQQTRKALAHAVTQANFLERIIEVVPTQQLIMLYCTEASVRKALLPSIMNRLYHQPLTLTKKPQANHYQLTLQQKSGDKIVWTAPAKPVEILIKAMRKKCPSQGGNCVIQ